MTDSLLRFRLAGNEPENVSLTPTLEIDPADRCDAWLTIDLREDELGIVVVPAFGPDHRAGVDCWCGAEPDPDEPEVIVHNAVN